MTAGAIIVLATIALLCIAMTYYVLVQMPRRNREQQRSTLKVFSTAVELRFPGQMGLTDRVVALSVAVGQQFRMSSVELHELEQAARLRDIGLCAIPWKLVNDRPAHEWSEAERSTYDRHTEVSGAMLELVPSLRSLAPLVRYHHAPFDGSQGPSYPQGRSLPLASRIIATVDAYVSLDRIQGDLLARSHLEAGKGNLFDPAVVEEFLRVLPSARGVETPPTAAIR